MTAREIKGKIIDFELYRMEKELEKFKDYDKKNLFADYYANYITIIY